MRRFVSGGASVLLAYPGQGQITATHQTLGPTQEVANLRTKFAICCPALAHGVSAEQCPGNVAMACTGPPPIERLQGAQMQQRRAARWSRQGSGNFAMKYTRLCLVLGQPCARGRVERHHQTASRAVFQFRGQRGTQAVRTMHRHENQLRARMRHALTTRNLPGAECPGYRGIVLARGACVEQFSSTNGPKWMRMACIQVRIIGNTSTPIGPPRPGGAYRASWHGKQGCGAGTPMRAQDRPGPRCRGRLPQRARARDSQRHRFGSSLFLLPWRFQKPAADGRATGRHQDS